MSKDLKRLVSETCRNLGKEHCRQREQHRPKPYSGNVLAHWRNRKGSGGLTRVGQLN